MCAFVSIWRDYMVFAVAVTTVDAAIHNGTQYLLLSIVQMCSIMCAFFIVACCCYSSSAKFILATLCELSQCCLCFFPRCCCSSSCMNVQSTLILLLLICCCLERFIDGFIFCSLDFRWLPFFSFASWCCLVLCDFLSPLTTNSHHFEREISEIRRMRRHFRQSNPIFDRIQPI